uniref:Putative Diguanylate cyclase n=1 Tax=Magnetococcus massalia (strain MO-1) TaxID=451514 RepID=A0A1S7LF12_MAGMO|nr:putative Diguanylate cyclase [Candidatus Magnetococcus massalia]
MINFSQDNRWPNLLMLIMAIVAMIVGGISVFTLYHTAFKIQRERLVDTAKSRARLMESVGRFNIAHPAKGYESGPFQATIKQIREAHKEFSGFGDTGEFTLAKREEDQIVFVLSHRHGDLEKPRPVSFAAKLAEPMRRALSGHSGTVVGLDYRGEKVLAAYEPVAVLGLGVVAKIDLDEIRAPFIRATLIVAGVAGMMIIIGVGLFSRITAPLLQRLKLTQKAVESVSEAIIITNTQGLTIDINPAYEQLTGYSRADVLGRNPNISQSGRHDHTFYEKMWQSLAENGSWEGEIWDRRKNGDIFPKWLTINVIKNAMGRVENYVGVFTDITEKKATEEKLRSLAFYDQLTLLANRSLFTEHVEMAIAASKRSQHPFALMYLDLDRFKQVNDTLGHAAGDELLCEVAERMRRNVRSIDTVARLGGDEFGLILTEIHSSEEVAHLAQQLIDAISQPVALKEREVQVGASIGITLYPEDGDTPALLSKHADIAMYQAKEAGRNGYQLFSQKLQQQIETRVTLEENLRQATELNQLQLHYQPKVCPETNQILGVESLVRWQPTTGPMVSPADFIPVAEETGLIVPMGEWILKTACLQTVQWSKSSTCPVKMAVNLSARQFREPNLIQMVKQTVDETGIPPECLELELTESMVMGNVDEAVEIMHCLRDLGLTLAMDDFGTGYSSLSYLKRFPINTLKIDQSFVRELQADGEDGAIVEAVISMAKSLHLNVVAEGVETAEQLAFLKERGCGMVQGYFYSKPLPEDKIAPLIQHGFL